jgi:hypothetical protein
MLHLLSTAINPAIPLGRALRHWQRIARRLAERPRKRIKQVPMLCSMLKLS